MILRKHFYPIIILLVLVMQMICPRAATAGEIEWQIRWQDNGILQEEIQIAGRDFAVADRNWTVSQAGNRYILRREVEGWSSYGEMKDRLPLQVEQRNYIVIKETTIITGSETAAGLFQQLNEGDKLSLNITVPGIITAGSGERIDESTSRWIFNPAELLQNRGMMTVITVDGLLLSIGLLLLGLLFVVIRFMKRLKKADQIIAEEYSITKKESDN